MLLDEREGRGHGQSWSDGHTFNVPARARSRRFCVVTATSPASPLGPRLCHVIWCKAVSSNEYDYELLNSPFKFRDATPGRRVHDERDD
jgi:hypothetical protein